MKCGGDHVHVLRNEGAVEARTIAVQLVPAGATRRLDAEGSAGCAGCDREFCGEPVDRLGLASLPIDRSV